MARTSARIGAGLFAIAAAVIGLTPSCSSSDTGTTSGAPGGGSPATTHTATTGAGGSMPNCKDYCDAIMANCTGDVQQYVDSEICLDTCADFPLGMISDTTGNTVGCRTYHAGAAAADPTFHCPHAGPGGDSYCGENCDGFCTLAMAACPHDFASDAACHSACMNFPDPNPDSFSINDQMGDTIECRLYHVTAATQDPTTHCPHITAASTPTTCGAPTP